MENKDVKIAYMKTHKFMRSIGARELGYYPNGAFRADLKPGQIWTLGLLVVLLIEPS
jgi:hypothetical protein